MTTTIPRSFAKKHLVLPIGIKDGYLTVATPNPFNVEVMEDIARASQLKVKVVVSTKSDRDVSLIRMRIDGVLHTVYQLPKNVHPAIISRIKNLARLYMAKKRKPQDKRSKIDKEGVEVEIRASTIPVISQRGDRGTFYGSRSGGKICKSTYRFSQRHLP